MALAVAKSVIPPSSGTGSYYMNNGASGTQTFSGSTTTGSLIVVIAVCWWQTNTPAGDAFAVTDNKGNAYTKAVDGFAAGVGNGGLGIYYCANATGGASHTVTCDPNQAEWYGTFAIYEVTGAATASVLDKTETGRGTSSTASVTAGTGTLSQADEIVFVAFSEGDPGTSVSTGYTYSMRSDSGSDTGGGAWAYKIVAATTSVTATYNQSGTTQPRYVVATFKQSGGAAATSRPVFRPALRFFNRRY